MKNIIEDAIPIIGGCYGPQGQTLWIPQQYLTEYLKEGYRIALVAPAHLQGTRGWEVNPLPSLAGAEGYEGVPA